MTEKENVVVVEEEKFVDISSELFRAYTFIIEGKFFNVRIDNPLKLIEGIKGDRILDIQGIGHYIPKGWIHIFWKVREGEDNKF